MKITIPEGYEIPAEAKDKGTFEELVTFKVEGDSIVPTMIAGVEIPAEKEEDDMEEEATASTEEEASKSPMGGMGERIMGMA